MKRIDSERLTRAASDVRKCIEPLERAIRDINRETGELHQLLEYAVWEEDMIQAKPIFFNGTVSELTNYLMPLLTSGKLRVESKENISAYIRMVELLFHIPCTDGKGYVKGETLLCEMGKYLRELRE